MNPGIAPELRFKPRSAADRRPPVMLLAGINVVRAFGLGGVPVVVAYEDRASPAIVSRYCSGTCDLRAASSDKKKVEILLRAGERLAGSAGQPVPLFCGEDRHLALVQQFRDQLSGPYVLSLNDPPVARALIDKAHFQELADARDLPVPRRLTVATLRDFAGPILVKPMSKARDHHGASLEGFFSRGAKARVFDSGAAVLREPLAIRLADSLVFQEYVPGDDRSIWSFHGFASESGELLEWFIGRKIRTHPPITGESSYLELAHDDELAALGSDLVRRIPLKGMFKIDFKRSAATGRFHMLEVNARCNLWLYLGARNGVNLARVAYDYLTTGQRPEHQATAHDYRWLALRLDYRAFRHLSAAGDLTALQWLRSLAESRKVYTLMSWSDPAPFAWQMWQHAASIPRRVGRRF